MIVSQYYVDSVDGDDTNAGTQDAPFKSLGKLQSTINPLGGTGPAIGFLKAGRTWDGSEETPDQTGSKIQITRDNVTLCKWGDGDDPIVDGQDNQTNVILVDDCSNVTISDIQATNGGSNGFYFQGNSCDATCIRCTGFSNGPTGDGFETGAATGGVVRLIECTAYNNYNDGFSQQGSFVVWCISCIAYGHTQDTNSDGYTSHGTGLMHIIGCTSYGNVDGIHLTNTTGTSYVFDNHVYGNSTLGIQLFPASGTPDFKVYNNVIHHAVDNQSCIKMGNTPTADIFNNTFEMANTGSSSRVIDIQNINISVSIVGNTFFQSATAHANNRIIRLTGVITTDDVITWMDYNAYDISNDESRSWFLTAGGTASYNKTNWLASGLVIDQNGDDIDASSLWSDSDVVTKQGDITNSALAAQPGAGASTIGAGLRLLPYFQQDQTGQLRPQKWDMGAVQYGRTSGNASGNQMTPYYMFLMQNLGI